MIRPIRATRHALKYYDSLVDDEFGWGASVGMQLQQTEEEGFKQFNTYTDGLTDFRKYLCKKGYEKEVIEIDKIFLDTHRGCDSEEEWEKDWEEYVRDMVIPDGFTLPSDAL